MRSLDDLGQHLTIGEDKLWEVTPGAFVGYSPMSHRSSEMELASGGGVIKKTKKRNSTKAIYELLCLDIWKTLLDRYSAANTVQLRAPQPVGLGNLTQESSDLFMEFIPGYELKKLSNLRRTLPVTFMLDDHEETLPLYHAAAYHLGALNALKEAEGLYHEDYDERHVILTPKGNVSMGVVDVERTTIRGEKDVGDESRFIFRRLQEYFAFVNGDPKALTTWYEEGRAALVIPGNQTHLADVVAEVERKHDVTIDLRHRYINSVEV